MANELEKINRSEIIDSTTSYFKRPEGVIGKVAIPAAIGTLGFVYFGQIANIWANLTAGMYNIMQLGIGGAVIYGSILLVKSKRVRQLGKFLSWHIYNKFIDTLDPKLILEETQAEQEELVATLSEKQSYITGSKEKVSGEISKNEEEILEGQESLQMMLIPGFKDSSLPLTQLLKPEQKGKELVVREIAEKQADLIEQNKSFAVYLQMLQQMDEKLTEAIDLARFTVRRTAHRRRMIIQSSTVLGESHGIISDIRKLLIDGSELSRLGTFAEEKLLKDIATDMGYFRNFVKEIEPLTGEMGVKQQVNVKRALDRLNSVGSNDRLLNEYRQENGELMSLSNGTAGSASVGVKVSANPFEAI